MKKLYLSNYICSPYIGIMFILFPLLMHNKLFDVVETKRNCFIGITIAFLVLCLLCALTSGQTINFKPSLPDFFMLGFVLSNIISYVFSSYKDIALYGINGRDFGLMTVIFIGISYFLITRFCILNKYIFYSIMIGSSLVSILGILNFFGIDPFGIYTDMLYSQTDFYIASLGHTNIYSSFFSLTLPVGVILYIKESGKKRQIFYFITSLISFVGLIVGNSDSGYITIGAVLLLAPLLSRSYKELAKFCFFIICSIILSRFTGILYTLFKCERMIDSLSKMLLTGNYLLPAAIILSGFLVFLVLSIKHKKNNLKRLQKIICISDIAIAALLVFVLLFANIKGYNGSFQNLLIWNDHWGSNRGFIWTRGWLLFTGYYSPLKIFFGCGPDSIKPLLEFYFGAEMCTGVFEHYDNVHNEYLQYLLTLGISGLAAYLGLLVTTIKKHISDNFHNVRYMSLFAAMVCYTLQAFVNINQAVTTPLFFIMIALLNSDNKNISD